MKVILDSNVLIAAAISRGLCESVMELCIENHEIFLCSAILREVREKLSGKLKFPVKLTNEYIRTLRENAHMRRPKPVQGICRDPNDDMILGLAERVQADVIISGDKDLLVLKSHQETRILTPRQFWEACRDAE